MVSQLDGCLLNTQRGAGWGPKAHWGFERHFLPADQRHVADQSVHFTQKALIVFLLKDSSSNFIKQDGISLVGPKVKLQSRCIAVEKKPLWEAAVTVSALSMDVVSEPHDFTYLSPGRSDVG